MNDKRFWNRVDELLDERLDPLEDRDVQVALREDPAKLVELERLTGRLARLDEAPIVASQFPIAKVALAAAGVVAVVSLSFMLSDSETEPERVLEISRLDAEPPSSLSLGRFRLSVTNSGLFGSRSSVVEDGRVSRTTFNEGSNGQPNRIILTVESSPRRLP